MSEPGVDGLWAATPDRSLLPRGLRTLILLRYKAFARRMLWGSQKRRVFSILGLALMAVYIVPNVLANRSRTPMDPDSIRLWLPAFLVVFVIVQLVFRPRRDPMTFQPAEMDLVLPGPFSRRQLVTYQMVYQFGPLLLMGLWIGIFLRTGGVYPARAIGAALVGQLISLLGSVTSALSGIIRARLKWVAPVMLVLAAALAYVAVRQAPPLPDGGGGAEWVQWASSVRKTEVIEDLCIPLRPYVETLLGTSFAGLVAAAAAALVINFGLMAAFVALDKGEVEALVIRSQKRLERFERRRTGTSALADAGRAVGRRVPMLPRMGGVGTLAWRQLSCAYRVSGRPVVILAAILLIGGAFWIGRAAPAAFGESAVLVFGVAASFWLPMIFRFDFRTDLDHMAVLKSLPLAPFAVIGGQIAAPLGVIVAIEAMFFAGLSAGFADWSVAMLSVGVLAGCVPLIGAMLAVENAVFLVAPTRSYRQMSPGGFDPSLLGRHFLLMLIKLVIVAVATAAIGGPVAAILWLDLGTGIAIATGVCVLLCVLAGLLYACTAAFRAFDVADDQVA